MRYALALLFALTACAAEPVLLPDSGPCSSACGAGTVCQAGACVAVDAGAADSGEDRPAPVDVVAVDVVAVDVGSEAGAVDAGVDAGPADAGSDAGAMDAPTPPTDTGLAIPDAGCVRSVQCGTGCFDLTTEDHCGSCSTACGPSQRCGEADGGRACVSRCTELQPDWCRAGLSPSGASLTNFCTNLASDNNNCGSCGGDRCSNGVRHCEFGRCVPN